MTQIKKLALGTVSAVALVAGFSAATATPAAAQSTFVFGGGATLPSLSNRELFNCYGAPYDTAGNPFSPVECTAPYAFDAAYLYAPVGSGAGQDAFIFNDSSRLGVPAASVTVPYAENTGPAPLQAYGVNFSTVAPTGYGQHHFSWSDAIVYQVAPTGTNKRRSWNCYQGITDPAVSDPSCVNTKAKAGNAKQVPTQVTTVNIPFNIPGFGGTLKLSEEAICGIFTGGIINWNDAAITGANPGFSVNGGAFTQIKVVVRQDSSGTTFLFTQWLDAVCTAARTGFEWNGPAGGSTGGATAPAFPPLWNNGGPAKPFFYAAPGSEGVAQAVASNNYAIGYVTPELTQPATLTVTVPANATYNDATGANPISVTAASSPVAADKAAAVENKSGTFTVPTRGTALQAVLSATPIQFGQPGFDDPAAWASTLAVPDPINAGAYPISGFTQALLYTCYADDAVANALRSFFEVLTSLQTGTQLRNILIGDAFGELPGAWRVAVRDLVVGRKQNRISGVTEDPSGQNPACLSVAGGAN